ncbi:hypothetical protein HDV57DRAFT_271944 [Trichoderma longibrachiatum]|uniref:Uncharacterized protein n=1 Tax=Trichoderma longibrachiatum ATCC 18648 TaxID=983965 RepID=A0A2T4BPC3_TRILO|nr:hypothetical protein M440DRAFT_23492 [Trichoderma longibrachiatum ATCC 18648]
MGAAPTPSAPAQRQTLPGARRPHTDEELAEREANAMRRLISRVREVRVHFTEEESRIYNGLSHHDGEGQVTFIWRAGEWLIQRRGECLVNLVVAELGHLCLSRGLVLDGLHNRGDGFRRAPADDFSARVSAEIEFGIGAVLQVVKEDTLSV